LYGARVGGSRLWPVWRDYAATKAPSKPCGPGAGSRAIGDPRPSRVLHDVKLGPGDEIFVAIPVRSGRCAERDSWTSVPFFDVKYRFLFFHHIAALPWGMENDMLIMHEPFGKPGQGGVFCAR